MQTPVQNHVQKDDWIRGFLCIGVHNGEGLKVYVLLEELGTISSGKRNLLKRKGNQWKYVMVGVKYLNGCYFREELD